METGINVAKKKHPRQIEMCFQSSGVSTLLYCYFVLFASLANANKIQLSPALFRLRDLAKRNKTIVSVELCMHACLYKCV